MKKNLLKIFAFVLVIAMVSVLFYGCGGGGGDNGEKTDDSGEKPTYTVSVGVMTPLSGASARSGEMYKASIEAALEDIATDAFLDPQYKLEFTYYDDQGTTDGAPTAANLAINDEVDICIGHLLTTMIMVSGQFFEDAEIPLIGIISGPKPAEQGWGFFHYGTVTDGDAAGALAEYLVKERGFKKVFILARNDEGGKIGADIVQKELEKLNTPAIGYELFNTDDTDFASQVMVAKSLEADCILSYGLSGANGLTCYNQIEQLYGKIPEEVYFCGSTAFAQPSMAETWDNESLDGICFPTGYIPNAADPFVDRFTKGYTEKDPLHMPAGDVPARVYDAVWNICQALNDLIKGEGAAMDPADADFSIKLNDYLSKVKRTGVQGEWDYGAFTDSRGLAKANIGMWIIGSDGKMTMEKVYPK